MSLERRGEVRRVAITGAGGFIGARLVERARGRGWSVRGLEIAPAAARVAEAGGAEVLVGDVNDPAAVSRLCQDADVVIHTAAVVEEGGAIDRHRRLTVDGTRAVATGARGAGVAQLVHLSSVMVYGFDFPPDVDEDGPLRGEGNAYCQSKIESEAVVRAFHAPGTMKVVIVRPGDVYGPRGPQWVLRPIALMKRRLFALPMRGRGVINHVYVDNLIDGIFAALDAPAAAVGGEARVLNVSDGVATSCASYFGRLAAIAGLPPPPCLPGPALRVLLGGAERVCDRLGIAPPARAAAVRYLERPHAYSIARARALGYTPRVTLDEGMARVREWLGGERLA